MRKKITIKIYGKAIAEEEYVKYLGILVDSKLTWKWHIDNLAKKVSRAIGVLSRIRYFVNRNILMNLYYSLIYPHLIYAIQVWGLTFETNSDKLIVLQKKTVRMMTFNRTFFSENGPPVTFRSSF